MGTTQTQTQPATMQVMVPGIAQAFADRLAANEEARQLPLQLWLPMVTGAPDTKATKKA
jgi:hypothetical protein